MPPFFKKRRRAKPGPSKNELKVKRREREDNEAPEQTLEQRWPGVRSITVKLEFFTHQGHLMDEQTIRFGPTDVPDFEIECQGRCGGDGLFDLSEKIGQAVASGQSTVIGNDLCAVPVFPGTRETCSLQLKSKVDLGY